ncbi:hypothetical protein ACET3Z_019164 [Daucus carota]
MDMIRDLASKKAAVIFTKSSCCMCHSIKALFYELGASPAVHEIDHDTNGREMEYALQRVEPVVHELDQDPEGREIEKALLRMGCNSPAVPAVFINGKLVGSTNEVMSLHLTGSLTPMLKPYQNIRQTLIPQFYILWILDQCFAELGRHMRCGNHDFSILLFRDLLSAPIEVSWRVKREKVLFN